MTNIFLTFPLRKYLFYKLIKEFIIKNSECICVYGEEG